MTIEQAIEKAIEGGWNPYEKPAKFLSACYSNGWLTNWSGECGKPLQRWIEADLLSPFFWQSLGKALGWDRDLEGLKCSCSEDIYYSYQFCPKCGKQMRKVEVMTTYWKKEWHRFIDHLAEGGTSESFFKDL